VALAYRSVHVQAYSGKINFPTDNIYASLHTVSYVPLPDTHAYVSDLSGELGTGGGYTAGGQLLTTKAVVYTTATAWTTLAAVSTAYAVETVVRPATANGYLYRCAVAGTSAASAPTWGTVIGGTTADNTVTWECVGRGAVSFTGANPAWSSATFGPCRYLVLSDRTPATAATQPLICYVNFGSDQTGGGGVFQVTWAAQGILLIFIP
jgi:hypothetical protein